MYKLVCGEYGVSPDYFFRFMGFAEAHDFLEGAQNRARDIWQCTRMLMYTNVATVGGAKGKTPEDIMSLPWDKDTQDTQEQKLTEERLQEIRARAQAMADKLNKKDE